MPTQKTINVYKYEELNNKAKLKARNWFSEGIALDDWATPVQEDAQQAGIKITEFDIYRRTIDVDLEGGLNCMNYILENHGPETETYKAAKAFDDAIDALPDMPPEYHANYNQKEREICEGMDSAEFDFKQAVEKAYLKMLEDAFDYALSDENLEAGITANDYEFLATGQICPV